MLLPPSAGGLVVQLMQHRIYVIFWLTVAVVFLAVALGILYELHQIVLLLRK